MVCRRLRWDLAAFHVCQHSKMGPKACTNPLPKRQFGQRSGRCYARRPTSPKISVAFSAAWHVLACASIPTCARLCQPTIPHPPKICCGRHGLELGRAMLGHEQKKSIWSLELMQVPTPSMVLVEVVNLIVNEDWSSHCLRDLQRDAAVCACPTFLCPQAHCDSDETHRMCHGSKLFLATA